MPGGFVPESQSEISIILPVCNQADHIERVIRRHHKDLSEAFGSDFFEIVLAVNGSTDDSEEICKNLSCQLDNVITVACESAGWGSAIQSGIKSSSSKLICYASSARVKSRVLLECIELAIQNPDHVIHAVRSGHDNKFRSLSSFCYNLESKVLFGTKSLDINGNPKVFPRKFEKLLKLQNNGFLVDLEFNVILKENNYPVIFHPIKHTERHGGKSMTGIIMGASLYLEAFKYWIARLVRNSSHDASQKFNSHGVPESVEI